MYSLIAAVIFYIVIGLVYWRLKMLKRKYLDPLFMWVMILGITFLCQPWFLLTGWVKTMADDWCLVRDYIKR